jgi:indolepyruvate ferredoxin oxidoreductase alpha subunit
MNQVEILNISSDAPGATLAMLGNEAIARGAIEAGVRVTAAYPGTPSSEITNTLMEIGKDHGMYVEWSVNEKVAVEVALSASLCGVRSLAVMKHVGVNVALDALMMASYVGIKGGMVLISADDPGQQSSQSEQDNRYLAAHGYIPVLEPYSAREAKDMLIDAFRLSEEFGQVFMLRTVTRLGHSRSDVLLGKINKEKRTGHFEKDDARLICLPANARRNRQLLVERFSRIKQAADNLPCNRLKLVAGAKLGIIASGISYGYVLDALNWMGIEGQLSLLKIGTPYPLPEGLTRRLLAAVPEALVIEEIEPFVENQVKVLAKDSNIPVKIHGKDLIPLFGELTTRKVIEAICKLTGDKTPVDFVEIDRRRAEAEKLLPLRPPTMCPGCPHRASLYAINVACERYRREYGVKPILPGDIGCHDLGYYPPLNAEDVSLCMGASFGVASGLPHVIDVPVVAHMGDSTFFHSGIPPVINAVFNKARVTMVVLDNRTTGMTGFQPHPGSIAGGEEPTIKIEDIARACGVKFVEVVDPFDLPGTIDVLERAIKYEGPSVVVSRRLCNILDQREKRRLAVEIVPHQVDREKCVADSPPYCQATCPLHIDVRGYVELIREGKFDEALALIKKRLPFPATVARICTHPCESKCRRAEVEEPIAINALKRSAADYGKVAEDDTIIEEKEGKIAIVGGGPAGLMAAYDLRKLGYGVTIFEALPVLGGMMAMGIPGFRLPKNILKNETAIMEKLGVEVKFNTRVGADIKFSDLRKKFDAVFIAVGAHKGLSLEIEGANVSGVVNGIEFLQQVNTGEKVPVAEKVVIVGGGNVAIDCARTCVRLGFKDVNIAYRRSRAEMPAIIEEVAEAEREGVKMHFLAGPNRVLAKNGKVAGIACLRMQLVEPDAGGRRRVVPVAGSEFVIETGMVIAAVGEQPDLQFMTGEAETTIVDGLLKADLITLETGLEGVFAGGDTVTGPATIIDALAAGRKAAISIDRYLRGEPLNIDREGDSPQVSKLVVEPYGISREPRRSMPTLPPEQRRGNFREVEPGLSREEAIKEASRCLSCRCWLCIDLLGCPAIIKDNGKAGIDVTQCPGCGVCVALCPHEAIISGVKDDNDKRD